MLFSVFHVHSFCYAHFIDMFESHAQYAQTQASIWSSLQIVLLLRISLEFNVSCLCASHFPRNLLKFPMNCSSTELLLLEQLLLELFPFLVWIFVVIWSVAGKCSFPALNFRISSFSYRIFSPGSILLNYLFLPVDVLGSCWLGRCSMRVTLLSWNCYTS